MLIIGPYRMTNRKGAKQRDEKRRERRDRVEDVRPKGEGRRPETRRAKRFRRSTRKEKGETEGRGLRVLLLLQP